MVISYMMFQLWRHGYHGYIIYVFQLCGHGYHGYVIYDVSVVEAWLPWLYHI